MHSVSAKGVLAPRSVGWNDRKNLSRHSYRYSRDTPWNVPFRNFFMLPIVIWTKGNQKDASAGGVIFFWYQRKICRMKPRVSRYGSLMVTLRTWINLTGLDIVRLRFVTAWAAKSFRPANLCQGLRANLFGAITFLPFKQGDSGHFHNKTSMSL